MISKPREKSIKLLTLEAATRRVSSTHEKYHLIEKEHAKYHYGYIGEKAMDFFLTFLTNKNTHLLNSLRIADPFNRHFQMDTLLITPCYCIILDSKYISGTLELDIPSGQLIRHKGEERERFGDPIAQISRQKYQLGLWLQKYNFPNLPILGLIVLSHHNATLINTTPQTMKEITYHTLIPDKISLIDNTYRKQLLNKDDMKRLVRTLKKKHEQDTFSFLSNFGMHHKDLINGVFCPSCQSPPMIRRYGNWRCSLCKHHSKEAHFPAITDFKLLVGNRITNKQFRDFLQISSESVSRKILCTLDLPTIGTTKGKTYLLEKFTPK